MDENLINETEVGIVKISDEVVGVISGLAASEINGVIAMSTGLVGGITQVLSGKKNLSKGVKVSVAENGATIELYIVVEYGVKIPEIAVLVQENVKKAVETMTGLTVAAVDIFVQNIVLPKDEKSQETTENQ